MKLGREGLLRQLHAHLANTRNPYTTVDCMSHHALLTEAGSDLFSKIFVQDGVINFIIHVEFLRSYMCVCMNTIHLRDCSVRCSEQKG